MRTSLNSTAESTDSYAERVSVKINRLLGDNAEISLRHNIDWTIFFLSAWGRFERHFSALIANIAKTSDLIDKQATTYHILEVKEWRQKSLDDSIAREQRWATEQVEAVLNWLGADVYAQNLRLDWLHTRSHAGTSSWITKHSKFRSWLQRGRGNPVLWIYGKPGSGQFFTNVQ